MKILILKPSSLGDVIQALPVLRLLKLHWPDSEIRWWIDANLAPLLEGDPDLAGVVLFERQRWASPRYWPEAWRSIRWLRNQTFDLVIDLQCLLRSGAVAWLANGQRLVGLDETREGARGFYDLAARRASYHTHAVDWYLEVLNLLEVPAHPNFVWLPERPAVAAEIKRKWQIDGAQWVILQPGARWLNKRWPTEYYAELAKKLVSGSPRRKVAVLGGESDRALSAAITRVIPEQCLDLAGKLSLPEMVEWIRRCELMISNDTGPMHVAAALNKPLAAIFGPTEPRRTGPYQRPASVIQTDDIPCVPCMKSRCAYHKPMECLRLIRPDQVLSHIARFSTGAMNPSPSTPSAGM